VSEAPLSVVVTQGRLRIDAPTGFDRASLLGALDIPLSHVVEAEVCADPIEQIRGWREGIGLPHLRMGTWRHDGVKDYVAARTGMPGLVVTLRDEAYQRLILSVADPDQVAALIQPEPRPAE
jgi:hypothetical protein